jgi:catechol 2,3-dioxygenase-like lactoylglutathione lyase family enzyme
VIQHETFFSIIAGDYDTTLEFYSAGLELPIVNQWNSARGRAALLKAGAASYVEVWSAPPGVYPAQVGSVGFAIEVDNADETYGRLRANGLEPEHEPNAMPWGFRGFAVRDPNGVSVSLVQRVDTQDDSIGGHVRLRPED